ncbi:2-hydroxychromene-2-carboxylate isomerase [Alcanivorax balearicus MACL04]|uniref:2-hydroxychromene-2-carboxylate isomerase n=1 Tax=Alloalcanivorax balearicus MACL04 TaxID=1177182 RepID=A0ABT2R038_9GAMM|nr:2-hydroxychromene-2-carboxylate isomerase [Alloalcanivorax balearicus]MCU5783128.1 2-hydroxychromene-2-carboxylate isomerase [Alloalcanivorax balearicus MACL04]
MIEFYFDCSSPWTYLGFESIQTVAKATGTSIEWKPILVGGIFNTINPSVYASREKPVPQKASYMRKDLQDWARYQGLEINWPEVFPVNSVKAMRGCLWLAPQGKLVPFARAMFQSYWRDGKDIAQDDQLIPILDQLGVDREAFFAGIQEPGIKDQLRENTEAAMRRGGFGSPTIFVDGDDMYFGNDRMPLIQAAIERRQGR